jgi:transposase
VGKYIRYGKEVKEQAVLRIFNEETTIRKTSEDLEVHYTTTRDWVRQYKEMKDESFPGSGSRNASDTEMMRLLKENADLKEENEFLKKTATFFAKDQK